MDESDKGAPGAGASGSGARPSQMPIGGMVRDPREVKTNPTLTRFLRERMTAGIIGSLVAIGFIRPKTPSGELGRRRWKGLFAFLGSLFAIVFVWTSVHVVQPGNVAVPVTLGHAGKPLSPGFHITLPFTTAYSLSTRTQNYTMTSSQPPGKRPANADNAVAVLGRDGGSASVSATVLYRVDSTKATSVYQRVGTGYTTSVVRPSAQFCIRTEFTRYGIVDAATASWNVVENGVADCMTNKLKGYGLVLQDFQLREVALASNIVTAVGNKVAAQQVEQQQAFDLLTSQKKAEITRVQAQANADQKEILQCGATVATVELGGQKVQRVVPNPPNKCVPAQFTQADLQYAYIQALQAFAASGNSSTVLLPGSGATPLITLPGGSNTGSNTATTPTTPTTPTSGP